MAVTQSSFMKMKQVHAFGLMRSLYKCRAMTMAQKSPYRCSLMLSSTASGWNLQCLGDNFATVIEQHLQFTIFVPGPKTHSVCHWKWCDCNQTCCLLCIWFSVIFPKTIFMSAFLGMVDFEETLSNNISRKSYVPGNATEKAFSANCSRTVNIVINNTYLFFTIRKCVIVQDHDRLHITVRADCNSSCSDRAHLFCS